MRVNGRGHSNKLTTRVLSTATELQSTSLDLLPARDRKPDRRENRRMSCEYFKRVFLETGKLGFAGLLLRPKICNFTVKSSAYLTHYSAEAILPCLCGSLAQCALSLKRLSAGPGFSPQTRQNKLFRDYWRACFEINFSDRQECLTMSSIICDH